MRRQSGAAAVEFALVLPILIILVLGIVEFGYFFFLNSAAAGAAREGARAAAISGATADGTVRAVQAFTDTTGRTATATVSPATTDCVPGSPVVVTVTSTYGSLTHFFGSSFTASGTGEMRCGG